jgi:hypothetical protein
VTDVVIQSFSKALPGVIPALTRGNAAAYLSRLLFMNVYSRHDPLNDIHADVKLLGLEHMSPVHRAMASL